MNLCAESLSIIKLDVITEMRYNRLFGMYIQFGIFNNDLDIMFTTIYTISIRKHNFELSTEDDEK